jgi:hypothetical protein
MRILLFTIMLAGLAAGCNTTGDVKDPLSGDAKSDRSRKAIPGQQTTIEWLDSVKNMGTITAGDSLKISFRFRNTGDKPLVIESVQPSCGCTVADYPKDPIAPGATGEITGAFNSVGKEGVQRKSMTVLTNTERQSYTLQFEVNVNKAK